jgi:hypothetical protein
MWARLESRADSGLSKLWTTVENWDEQLASREMNQA